MATEGRELREINSPEEIPEFSSEAEEAEYWSRHALGEGLLERMAPLPEAELPPSRPSTRSVVVRLDQDALRRLKALAEKQHKGYQTLLKEFVLQRLYEEE